jgi:uncharacterized cysteine cluster protein YcgN (CxxCxxCC family)
MTSRNPSDKDSEATAPARARRLPQGAPTKEKGGDLPFWRRKTLAQMNSVEWESLCDGCAKCCLVKLEYEDTGEVEHTDIACRLLDPTSCRCSDYAHRHEKVSDCLSLTPRSLRRLKWLPSTCAYRLVGEGRDLYWWHPLVSGDPETVHMAGMSVRGRVVSEEDGLAPEDRIIDWVE